MTDLGVAPMSATAERDGETLRILQTQLSARQVWLRTDANAHHHQQRRPDLALARRSGFDSLPFTGCTLARGRRL